MPSSLLKSSPTQINFVSTTRRMFSNVSDLTALVGTPTLAMLPVPDGTGEVLASMTNSGAAANIGCLANIETRLYTGRTALAVYLDDFGSAAGVPDNTSTQFHQARLGVNFVKDGTPDNASHFYNVMLNRGWNVITMSRAMVANVARNGSATVSPTLGGTGTTALSGGTSGDGAGTPATQSTSLFDSTTTFSGPQLRLILYAAPSGLFHRLFIKEIVDDYQCDSKTCLIFDDARDTVYTVAYPLMRNRGLVGTLPIISSFVGTPGYMTVAQITELFRAGWDIVNHTKSHLTGTQMEALSDANLRAEIVDCDAFIVANGWNRNNANKYFVAPFGGMQQQNCVRYRQAILDAGCVASFGTTNRCIGGQLLSPYFIPRLDFNTTGPTGSYITGTGYAIGTMVDQYTNAVMNGASPMIMLHQFVNVPTDSTMLAATELETLLDRVLSLKLSGFTSVEGVTTAIPALTQGVGTGIRNLR